MHVPVLIVGAGFSGSVCAQLLAANGHRVLLIDKRPHVGGNAYDTIDAQGLRIHVYGPHIFHTNSQRVFDSVIVVTDIVAYELGQGPELTEVYHAAVMILVVLALSSSAATTWCNGKRPSLTARR